MFIVLSIPYLHLQACIDGNAPSSLYRRNYLYDGKYFRHATRRVVRWCVPRSVFSQLLLRSRYTGIPLNDSNIRLGIAELSQQILGDKLIGIQIGNEPDLYARHGARPEVRIWLRSHLCILFISTIELRSDGLRCRVHGGHERFAKQPSHPDA